MNLTDRNLYGATEVNGLVDPKGYHEAIGPLKETVDWSDPDLAEVTRLRFLSDPGFPYWDVSYCHGRLKSGEYVRVRLPFRQLPKGRVNRTIVEYARRDGVYAKGLGILENQSFLQ